MAKSEEMEANWVENMGGDGVGHRWGIGRKKGSFAFYLVA